MAVKSMIQFINHLMQQKENKCVKIYYNISNSNKKKKKSKKNLSKNNSF